MSTQSVALRNGMAGLKEALPCLRDPGDDPNPRNLRDFFVPPASPHGCVWCGSSRVAPSWARGRLWRASRTTFRSTVTLVRFVVTTVASSALLAPSRPRIPHLQNGGGQRG